jgi:hypothetical protein
MTASAWGLLCLAANAVAPDATGENPYKAIPDRNVFGLRPPVTAAETNQPPKQPPVNLTLTGFYTTLMGQKRVLLKTAPMPAKGAQPAKAEQSYMLSEGQREGDIEVLQINELARIVKINNNGVEMFLDFTNNGVKMPAMAAIAPGMVPPPGGVPPRTGLQPIPAPAGYTAPASGSGMRPLPSRPLRAVPAGSASTTSSGAGAASVRTPTSSRSAAAQNALTVTPVPNQGGTVEAHLSVGASRPQPTLQPNWPPEVQLTPEEQALLIEAQREVHANDPNHPPLPPTPLRLLSSAGAEPCLATVKPIWA